MARNKKISMAVIRRLPRYYRYLSELMRNDITRISSKELSKRMGITASQIRQDLNCFGGFGQQGYGYNVEYLNSEISKILGLEKPFNCVIIGAGRLGKALVNYPYFTERGYIIKGIFDVDENIIGQVENGIEIKHFNNLKQEVEGKDIDIAMLTVSNNNIRKVALDVVKAGINGIWNFSPTDLNIPYDVVIENVHLSDSLMVLGYNLTNMQNRSDEEI